MTGTDAGPRDSGPLPGPAFNVLVVDTEDGMPITSATVTLDLPGRPRMELTTGPDGRASFAGVDPEANAPTVTAYRTGRRLITYASVDMTMRGLLRAASLEMPDGSVVLPLRERTDTAMQVELMGSATNMMDEADNLSVFVNAPLGTDSHMVGPMWAITVPSGAPFSLIALEWANGMDMSLSPRGRLIDARAWLIIDSPGVTMAGTLPIDFATPETTMMVSGSFPVPPASRGEFFMDSAPNLSVVERETRALYGIATRIDVDPAGTQAPYEVQYVPLPGTMQADSVYSLARGPLSSVVIERGLPRDDHAPDFATPPSVDLPAFGVPHPLFDRVEFTVRDETMPVVMTVTDVESEAGRWVAYFPPGTTNVTLPALPSTANVATDLSTGELDGRISTCDLDPVQPLFCQRSATSRAFQLVP